ncbi:MAG: hypothetical protein ACI3XQ_09690 [Eubacteriales bacterium]
MKKMKKIISVVLCALMLASCIIHVSAADPTPDFSQNLVVHYDFEGDTQEERLADKAPAGVSKENLTVYGTDGTEVKNGSAFIAQEAGNYLACMFEDADVENGAGTDVRNLRNSAGGANFTVAISFKMDCDPAYNDTNKSAKYLVDINNSFSLSVSRPFTNGTHSSTGVVMPSTGFDGTNFAQSAGRVTQSFSGSNSSLAINRTEKHVIMVASVTVTAAGEATISTHYSLDGGKTVAKLGSNMILATKDTLKYVEWLALGKCISTGINQNTITDFEIDDFRIYNTTLNVANSKALIPLMAPGADFYGYQTSAIKDNKFDIRFVGSIEGSHYDKIGFKVTATYTGGTQSWDKSGTKVFEKLLGSSDGDLLEYTPSLVRGNGSYLYALTILNIPDDVGSIEFSVTPYYVIGTDTVEGTSKTFTIDTTSLS